jgi:hypothetical protein
MAFIKTNKYPSLPRKFMYFSQGTGYAFDPSKNASLNGRLSNLLEVHKAEVKFRNRKDVFILTDTGEVFPVR